MIGGIGRQGAAWIVVAAGLAGCAGSAPSERGVSLGALGEESVRPTPVVLSTEEWSFAGAPGWVIRTPHYRIYTTERDEMMRRRMGAFCEHAIAQYRTAITTLPRPVSKLDVYLMDNRSQWEVLTRRLMGSSGSDLGHIERGGYASRGIGVYYDLGLYDTLAIAAHEGWHQYTQRVFRDPLPVWLEEGMATYMEGHRWNGGEVEFLAWANTERFDRLRDAVLGGRRISLGRLLGMQPREELGMGGQGVLDYYAHVWALVHFLHEGEGGAYRTQLAELLGDASRGDMRRRLESDLGRMGARRALTRRVGDAVLTTYFGMGATGLERAFERFVGEVVATGSREAIVAGRSPVGE